MSSGVPSPGDSYPDSRRYNQLRNTRATERPTIDPTVPGQGPNDDDSGTDGFAAEPDVPGNDELVEAILARLAQARLDISRIRVMAEEGRVTLEGAVASDQDRDTAAREAGQLEAVVSVINGLRVG